MAIRKYRSVVLYNGNPLPGVSVTVKLAGSATLATLYSDAAGTVPLANPFTNNATYGSFEFYTEEGTYDLTLAKVGYSLEALPNTLVGSPATVTAGPFTVNAVNGAATLTVSNAIPAGAKDVSAFVENAVAFGTSGNMTGYDVGDGVVPDKWSAGRSGGIPVTLGFISAQEDFGPDVSGIYHTASPVILTARNGTFDGTGQALVTVKYRMDGP